MKIEKLSPIIIMVIQAGATLVYFLNDPSDWRKYSYWFACVLMNIAVTF